MTSQRFLRKKQTSTCTTMVQRFKPERCKLYKLIKCHTPSGATPTFEKKFKICTFQVPSTCTSSFQAQKVPIVKTNEVPHTPHSAPLVF